MKDVDEDAVEAEVSYLRTTFFANQPVDFPMRRITGLDRFSMSSDNGTGGLDSGAEPQ